MSIALLYYNLWESLFTIYSGIKYTSLQCNVYNDYIGLLDGTLASAVTPALQLIVDLIVSLDFSMDLGTIIHECRQCMVSEFLSQIHT